VPRAMMRDGAGLLVESVGAEIRRVADDRCLRLVWSGFGARERRPYPIGHDLHGHVPVRVAVNQAGGMEAALRVRLAVRGHRDEPPGSEKAFRRVASGT